MKLTKFLTLLLISALSIMGMERPLFIDKMPHGPLPSDIYEELINFVSNGKKNEAFLLSGVNHKDAKEKDFNKEEISFTFDSELLPDADHMFCWPDSSSEQENILKLWQIKGGKPFSCQIPNKTDAEINCITGAHSGQLFFIGSSNGDLCVWEPKKGTSSVLKNIMRASIKGLSFYEPKKYLSIIDSNGQIVVCKYFPDRLDIYKNLKSKHSIPAKAMLFYNETKNQLIVCSDYIEVFDLETAAPVFHSEGSKYTFNDIHFDRSSQKLFASQGKSIYCWDMKNIGTKEPVKASYGFNHSIGQFIYDSFSQLVFTVTPISTTPPGLQIKLLDLKNKKSIPIAYLSSARAMIYDANHKKLFCTLLNGNMEVLDLANPELKNCTVQQAAAINLAYEQSLNKSNNKRKK